MGDYDVDDTCPICNKYESECLCDEPRFVNHYECPRCEHQWTDEWAAASNDDCPECGLRDVEPYYSIEISED